MSSGRGQSSGHNNNSTNNSTNPGKGGGGGRKSLLVDYANKEVNVITNDGRNFVGHMRGFDQVCNIILEKSSERIFSADKGVKIVSLGLYVIRGDNIAIVGLVDSEKDKQIQWTAIKVSVVSISTFQPYDPVKSDRADVKLVS